MLREQRSSVDGQRQNFTTDRSPKNGVIAPSSYYTFSAICSQFSVNSEEAATILEHLDGLETPVPVRTSGAIILSGKSWMEVIRGALQAGGER